MQPTHLFAALVALFVSLAATSLAEHVVPQPAGFDAPSSLGAVPVSVSHVQPASSANAYEPAVVVAQPVAHQHVPSHYAPVGVLPEPASFEQPRPDSYFNAVPSTGAALKPEQYGQPESSAIPANYKPFGSWGLYIGGNPADGYYTNFYKSLSESVEKQSAAGSVAPLLRQQPSHQQAASPYPGSDYYPFSYSPADFAVNSQPLGARNALAPLASADFYYGAAKGHSESSKSSHSKSSSQHQQQQQQEEQAPVKSSPKNLSPVVKSAHSYAAAPSYYYSAPVSGAPQVAQAVAPVVHKQAAESQQQQQQPQVVAYPVPVGSQIVGSQVGVDGAFYPYGIHAFTKYAVKPTVVSGPQAAAYDAPQLLAGAYSPAQFSVVQPSYKYAAYAPFYSPSYYHPSSYYAYPANQLHYSNGLVVPASVQQQSEADVAVVQYSATAPSAQAPVPAPASSQESALAPAPVAQANQVEPKLDEIAQSKF